MALPSWRCELIIATSELHLYFLLLNCSLFTTDFCSQVQCIKIVMLIPSSKVFVAPPSLALLAKVNKTTPNIQNLHENIDQEWNQDLHKILAIGCLTGRQISFPLHIQQSIILFLLHLQCNTTCNGSERQWIFPNLWLHLLRNKTKSSVTHGLHKMLFSLVCLKILMLWKFLFYYVEYSNLLKPYTKPNL